MSNKEDFDRAISALVRERALDTILSIDLGERFEKIIKQAVTAGQMENAASSWNEGVLWALNQCGYPADWLDARDLPDETTREEANPYRGGKP